MLFRSVGDDAAVNTVDDYASSCADAFDNHFTGSGADDDAFGSHGIDAGFLGVVESLAEFVVGFLDLSLGVVVGVGYDVLGVVEG